MNPIRVTVLVTNTAWGTGLLGEHGLSFWIDTGSRRLLFDTGQGLAIAGNARALRIELARADAIALSHGHYDHTGGLRYAMSEAKQARLYLHPHALIRRYTGVRSEGREIGLASINEQELRQDVSGFFRCPMNDKNFVLERYYLDCRCMLLELAATLDRYDRAAIAPGSTHSSDQRLILLQRAVQILADPGAQPDRAERILRMLSDRVD